MEYSEVKQHVDVLETAWEKIMYLREVKTDYLQNRIGLRIEDSALMRLSQGLPFDEKCDIEISGIIETMQLEAQLKAQPEAHTTPNLSFKLSKRKAARTDLIRVLSALHELQMVERKADGQFPTKAEFMVTVGGFFGLNLSNYHVNLSQALNNQSIEANLEVFEEMIAKTKKAHSGG
jgi:hypothetical protein